MAGCTVRTGDTTRGVVERLQAYVLASSTPIFLTKDFAEAAEKVAHRRTMYRALTRLQDDGVIVRLARGIYVRACRSPLSGRYIPEGGLSQIVQAVAERLGRHVIQDEATRRYNRRESTQVPTGRYVEVSGPVMRVALQFPRGTVTMVALGECA